VTVEAACTRAPAPLAGSPAPLESRCRQTATEEEVLKVSSAWPCLKQLSLTCLPWLCAYFCIRVPVYLFQLTANCMWRIVWFFVAWAETMTLRQARSRPRWPRPLA